MEGEGDGRAERGEVGRWRGLGILHRSGSNLKGRVEWEGEERGSRF